MSNLNKQYGYPDALINLAKNEIYKCFAVDSAKVLKRAGAFFPEVELDITGIDDLLYHLRKDQVQHMKDFDSSALPCGDQDRHHEELCGLIEEFEALKK